MLGILFGSFISLRSTNNPVIYSYCISVSIKGVLRAHFILQETCHCWTVSHTPGTVIGSRMKVDFLSC